MRCAFPLSNCGKSQSSQKTRVGEKIRELNDLSPPEHTHTLTHTETQTEGAHSTPPSEYIRDVLHTQMTVLCRIFSSEVMLEAADFHCAELLLLVYTGWLIFFYFIIYSFPWIGSNCALMFLHIQTLGPSSVWCGCRRPRTEKTSNTSESSWGMNLSLCVWKACFK